MICSGLYREQIRSKRESWRGTRASVFPGLRFFSEKLYLWSTVKMELRPELGSPIMPILRMVPGRPSFTGVTGIVGSGTLDLGFLVAAVLKSRRGMASIEKIRVWVLNF